MLPDKGCWCKDPLLLLLFGLEDENREFEKDEDADDDKRPSLLSLPRFWNANRLEKITDGGQLEARMQNDERKDVGKRDDG